jgi:hypothetical protein
VRPADRRWIHDVAAAISYESGAIEGIEAIAFFEDMGAVAAAADLDGGLSIADLMQCFPVGRPVDEDIPGKIATAYGGQVQNGFPTFFQRGDRVDQLGR